VGDEDRSGLPAAVCRIAAGFDTALAFLNFALECSGEVIQTAEGETARGRVTISTLHKAKGLEWPVVFLSATKGVFPHKRRANDPEEERLFYVGATRAKETLHLTWSALDLRGNEAGPSRFLAYASPQVGSGSKDAYCNECKATVVVGRCEHGVEAKPAAVAVE